MVHTLNLHLLERNVNIHGTHARCVALSTVSSAVLALLILNAGFSTAMFISRVKREPCREKNPVAGCLNSQARVLPTQTAFRVSYSTVIVYFLVEFRYPAQTSDSHVQQETVLQTFHLFC